MTVLNDVNTIDVINVREKIKNVKNKRKTPFKREKTFIKSELVFVFGLVDLKLSDYFLLCTDTKSHTGCGKIK